MSNVDFWEKPGEIRVLSRSVTESMLDMKRVLNIVEETFKWIGEGKVEQRHEEPIIPVKDEEGTRICFILGHPAYIKPLNVVGNKWSGASEHSPKLGLLASTGIVILNDPKTAMPFAIVDSATITTIRTACHAGVGAKYLARKSSSIVAIIGCGVQGRSHLEVMNELFKLKEARIYDIRKEAQKIFLDEMSKKFPNLKIEPIETPKEAVKNADIICTVTRSSKPVVLEEWIESGCHVAATNGFNDLDPKFSKKADKWVLGNWERDLMWVKSESSLSKKDIYSDLSEIVIGKKHGREHDSERTVMTHLGMGALDVPTAYEAYRRAREKELGDKVRLFTPDIKYSIWGIKPKW